jgi:hypothetical protein
MSPCKGATAYRGPLIVIGLGVGFVAVGSIPVAVTFCLGTKNSATIIGVGFIGFGLLLVLPGIMWCIVRRITTFRCCTKRKRLRSVETQEKTPSFENIPSGHLVVADSKALSPKKKRGVEECEQDPEEPEPDDREYGKDQDKGPVLLKR